jgi:RNA polymerase sigma-70 factor, ECF subfamily
MPTEPARAHPLRLVPPPGTTLRVRPPSVDDGELLARVREGDPSVAALLYERARPAAARVIARLLGRSDVDREDLLQLAMIELITTIDRYRGECSLDSWIGTLSARVVFKHIRRRKLERQFMSGEALDEGRLESAENAAGGAVTRDLVAKVRRHLEALEPNKAWTFLLHDVWGYDLQEIATITGATVAAAQTRLVRGRRELHERVAGDPELANLLDDLEDGP